MKILINNNTIINSDLFTITKYEDIDEDKYSQLINRLIKRYSVNFSKMFLLYDCEFFTKIRNKFLNKKYNKKYISYKIKFIRNEEKYVIQFKTKEERDREFNKLFED